ncbi:YqiJ family protein [Moraxella bovis]|uniref:YqiJ family protein n=1 Tax=Moraxella bovis TaxID=476 RepID=UPI00222605D7|nr:YqiJ family protein [Moraxella bovis]UYZ67702.1 YqiJ family protein [Moraxella bovis]UYZ70075.1 YqiJ family protein [Moraxella bovis]UYZ74013.1 YqiJ family protein [Moraxella bovis]UYZ90415.1 YqiJ family protein [Moraxella bovis]UZA13366.1 YqiJ family protein [Moraxella bovis]
MLDLIFAPQNFIFGVAITLMFLLFILEIVALMIGGANDWVDGLLPDELNAHAEVGVDVADAGIAVRFLSWLYVGKVPVLMLLVLFLAIFGLLGFFIQGILFNLAGFYLPSLIAIIVVWALSLPILRVFAKGLYKILPKDETTAINQSELVGRIGTVVIGKATKDTPAQIKVKDTHGQTHYIMAYADDEDLIQGETVLLVLQKEMYFVAIKNMNGVLVD